MAPRARAAALAVVCLVIGAMAGPIAQTRPPRAEVTAIAERDAVARGQAVRVAVKVVLPPGLHANSNKPRDPSLIPTILSISPPDGVAVEEIVYPTPGDLVQKGADQPLSVFEQEFYIGAVLSVAPDAPQDALAVPARLRYQACDESVCYLPATAQVQWTLQTGSSPASAGAPNAAHAALFAKIAFGSGERPAAAAAEGEAETAPVTAAPASDAMQALDRFTVAGVGAGYLGTADFLAFIRNAEKGVVEQGWFEGRGAAAILAIVLLGGLALNLTPCVLPMIPINLAIIGAGAQAGSRKRGLLLGATYGINSMKRSSHGQSIFARSPMPPAFPMKNSDS